MTNDYYKTLGVDRNASESDIKKAFRAKAQEYHPDKQGGDETMFKKINEAYTTLKDNKKRAQYDQFGQSGPAGSGFGGQQQGGFGGFGGFQQGGVEFDMSDIFDMFGGGGGRGRTQRGADISVEIDVAFAESIFGTEKSFSITKNNTCAVCGGTGAKNKKTKTCNTCNGNGRVAQVQQTIMGTVQREVICSDCHGSGQKPETDCSNCHGSGVSRGEEEVNVKIPAGIENGQQLRLRERGEAMVGGASGDLYITVRVSRDTRFDKIGNDLKTDLSISVPDAVLGAQHEIDTVDGTVKIKIPAGTTHGSLLRVKGQGVGARKSTRGDLYVQILIEVPKKLSKEEKDLYEKLR